jgi:diguanylate cyclase (GGDEF)-like protein/PAS domain S-box-containing protein
MTMGTPTQRPIPAWLGHMLVLVFLGIGVALTSSSLPFHRTLGLAALAAAGLLVAIGLQQTFQTHGRLHRDERTWRQFQAGLPDAMLLLTPRVDSLGKLMGFDVLEANSAAQTLLADPSSPWPVNQLEALLPQHVCEALHAQIRQAHVSRQPSQQDHALHTKGNGGTSAKGGHSRWLQWQVIPVSEGMVLLARDVTEAHHASHALREREAFYRSLVDSLPMAVFARSARPGTAGQYVLWNQAAAAVMQRAPEEMLGRKGLDLLPPEVVERGDQQDLSVLREPRVHHFPNLVYEAPSGTRIVDLIKAPVFGTDGEVDHILSIARDVTELRETADKLRLASRVVEETGDAVVVSDPLDRVLMVNPAFLNLSGLSPAEVIGQNAELLGLAPLRESHLPGVVQALHSGQRWSGESRQVVQDGRSLDTWMSVSTLRNAQDKVTQHIRVFSDISVLKAHHRELVEQARHDSLTGLPNRRAFGERLHQAVARARRQPRTMAVLYIDLDGFKAVNDRHGHATGDALLMEVAKRLLLCVRLTDCVCRLAGDEFTVILEGAGMPAEVRMVCQRIVDRLSLPHTFHGETVIATPSVGAALYDPGETTEAICQRADAAMYEAKRNGKARYVLSESSSTVMAMPMLRTGANA